jgi:hypothetical protein
LHMTQGYSLCCLEEVRLLKNTLGTRFRPRSGTKHAGFGAFEARFVVAISSTPTFSTASVVFSETEFLASRVFGKFDKHLLK